MNDQTKPIAEIEKELLSRRRGPRTPLKAREPSRKVSSGEAAERVHSDFPKTIKYLGQ
jgi:hypothetical protein